MFVLKGEMHMSIQLKKLSADEFAKWLQSNETEVRLVEYKHPRAYFKNRLPNGLDILYMYRYPTEDGIAVNSEPEYQGLCKRDTGELYDVGYETFEVLKETGQVMYGSSNITEDIEERVRTLVESMVGKYISTISEKDIDEDRRKILEDQAWGIAKKRYLEDITVENEYQCDYSVKDYHKHLVDFILNKEKIACEIAEEFHEKNKGEIVEEIIRNRYTIAESKKFNNGEYYDYTAMKRIIHSIPEKSQSVNVTIYKDGKEMIFKYEARYLRYDCGRCYSTWNMPCLARGTFEDLYGRGAELYPTDITKITYGRKVIYEKE